MPVGDWMWGGPELDPLQLSALKPEQRFPLVQKGPAQTVTQSLYSTARTVSQRHNQHYFYTFTRITNHLVVS